MESERRDLKAHIESSPRVATVGSVAEISILAKYAGARVHYRESSISDTIDLLEVLKRHVYDKITTEIGP
ncbi:MAG: hypothetical protein GTN76_16805, partial [Candidatus Aenigmarchaeota archaeon]|nr:hypothetical protein [Candidatus Aenigmarchaeota archaeon]